MLAPLCAAVVLFAPSAAVGAITDSAGEPIPDLGVAAELAAVATVPDSSFGTAPRLNMIAVTGSRIFVVEERDGLIYELLSVDDTTALEVVPFFDVAAAIDAATDRELDTSNLFHGGLRSLAFHPDFATNGLLYVSVMESRPANPSLHRYLSDSPSPINADSVLIEFSYDHQSNDVDPLSYREVFRVGMPVYDHPIKQIAFDPGADGADRDLLYIAHGDGSVLSAQAGGGQGNDALGKILRIDPRATADAPFSVPDDNPFVGDPSMIDEAYSIGHRNPHHLAFAEHPFDGSRVLIAAEPGRDNIEEVNLIERGGDYGWPQREGTFVHLEAGGRTTGIDPLPSDDSTNGFVYPAAQYLHSGAPGSTVTGEAIAGGFVVDNGSPLSGHYFFADFPSTGTLFSVDVADLTSAATTLGSNESPSALSPATIGLVSISLDHDNDRSTESVSRSDLRDVFDDATTYETTRADVRFGQGPAGEIYVMSKRNNTIYLVLNSVAPPAPEDELPRYLDDQILRLYRAALGRVPDAEGLAFWVSQAREGATLDDIARQFIESAEFTERFGSDLSSLALVERLYQNVLERPAEPSGVSFWLAELDAGANPASVLVGFTDSPENVERTGTSAPISPSEAKILRLYRAALGRTPDSAGLSFWVDRFNGGASLATIASQFRSSPEFADRYGSNLSDDAFVELLYRNVLGRDGDPGGQSFWVAELDRGETRDTVLVAFSESVENLERTNTRP